MEAAKAIQIITLENNSLKFHPEKLRPFFEREDLKNRQAVIVSIAGAFRKGKSFLLNFFLKYLYAQVRRNESRHHFLQRVFLEFKTFPSFLSIVQKS